MKKNHHLFCVCAYIGCDIVWMAKHFSKCVIIFYGRTVYIDRVRLKPPPKNFK